MRSKLAKKTVTTPGEKISVIEEFDAGEKTYVQDGNVRALRIGVTSQNLDKRIININSFKEKDRIPKPGDSVIGKVETAQTNVINILIESINGEDSQGSFKGMLQIGYDNFRRGRRKRGSVCKAGDLIRAHVFSNINSIIHLSVDDNEDGVIRTICSTCGGNVVRIRDNVKCTECGNVEERKLASSFGKL